MSNTYKIGQLELAYCRATHNKCFVNERTIEIGLGEYFINKFGNDVVEVGSVMLYYGYDSHIIIDLTDLHPKVHRINALDCNYKDFDVLCLSTIEHMMKREYSNGSDDDSINFLNKVISEARNYLITFPCCYNKFLDEYVKNSSINRILLKRISEQNEWVQDFDIKNMDYLFGHRDSRVPDGRFNNANALNIVTNLPEILSNEQNFSPNIRPC